MKAAVLHEVGEPMRIEDVEVDDLQSTEVLVRTAVAGLCHSDLHFATGAWPIELPVVLGHEGSGVVEEVGSAVTRVKPGDHVVVFNAPSCGRCKPCLRGRPTLCTAPPRNRPDPARPRLSLSGRNVGTLDSLGTFAEKMVVNEAALSAIAPDVSLEVASLISCAVMAGFGATAYTAGVRSGESVAIIGVGGIGLNAVQAAVHVGAGPIIAVDTNRDNLELARQLGATCTVDARQKNPVDVVMQTYGGVDHVIEAIGLKQTTEQGWAMLAPGGCVTVVGMIQLDARIEITPGDLLEKEKRIQGSHMGSRHWELQLPLLLDLYRSGRLQLDSLITSRLSLDDINDGYARMTAGARGRQVIVF